MNDLYVRENYLKKIRGFYGETEIIKVITGVRRCGKSSIMKMIIDELIQSGVDPQNIIYIPLDVRPYKTVKTPERLESIIDKKASGVSGKKYLFIDEVQKVKGFEDTVNSYRIEGFSVFLTGSNGYLLSGELATNLTGRYIEFEISTLTFSEYIGMKRFFGKTVNPDLDVEFVNYILEGGFPLAVKFDSFEDKRNYVTSVIKEIHEKDIKTNKKIRKKQLFNKLETYIINNFGATTSVPILCEKLAEDPKHPVRRETIYTYLEILEKAKIISKCSRFDMKSKKSINGGEKYYLSDLSFYFCTNTDNRINYGPVLENIVYNYTKSCSYAISIGRIGKLEVDFITRDMNMDYSYIQVARTIDNDNFDEDGKNLTEEREYRPLELINDGYPKYLITMDKLLQKRSGVKHINIVKSMMDGVQF